MYLVTKSNKYEVIELSTIERGVHLIPDYGPIGTITPWIEMQKRGTKLPCRLDAFNKFVINNYLDLDMYNTIF